MNDENDYYAEWLLQELYRAYIEARRGKRRTVDEDIFELNVFENLVKLRDDIIGRTYKPGRGIAFVIRRPVIREVFAAPFRDRIVHHFLYNMNAGWWDKRLIYDSYSCRAGKGTLFGVKRLEHHTRAVSKNYTQPAYVIKLDIQGYFMSLPRKALYERMLWGLDRQYPDGGILYDTCKFLWREVIFDDPIQGVHKKGSEKDWDDLPKSKSLFHQPKGQGIVIGNLSSQLLSNIYLDQLDRYITMTLGYKAYGRYVDDFYIVVDESRYEQAKRDAYAIEKYLTEINLTLHPKKRHMQDIKKGVEFLGAVVYPWRIVPGKRIKRNFYKAAWQYAVGFDEDISIGSYMGHLEHIKGKKLTSKVFDSVGWQYRF